MRARRTRFIRVGTASHMRKAAKVRLSPTDNQKQLLAQQFGCARCGRIRAAWNKALGLQYEHRSTQGLDGVRQSQTATVA